MLVQNYQMALKYLERSNKVFKEHGYRKQIEEIEEKIQMIYEVRDKQLGKQVYNYNLDEYTF